MIVFHIDANSAYLSWEAVNRLQNGYSLDIRTVPAVIGGDPIKRKGIVLTKSIPAKKYGIVTGETIFSAQQKCPDLVIVPPNYDLYLKCSNAMFSLIKEYSPVIERYSIDECFLDFTYSQKLLGDPIKIALEIKERIKNELGFTVNIGVSNNKLLAKMGSELRKPDMLHTLFPDEIEKKLWPLPVEELFMVGRATTKKLKQININTIGDLANTHPSYLKTLLKSHGVLIHNYANGVDYSIVKHDNFVMQKGIGNSTTTAFDVVTSNEALLVLLALTEKVCMRLRNTQALCNIISISVKESDFAYFSHQRKIDSPTDSTSEIFAIVKSLFLESWNKKPLRSLGVRVSELCTNEFYQCSIFDSQYKEKNRKLDKVLDNIRARYGDVAIQRGGFLNSNIKPIQGGVSEEDYPMMKALL